jgi:hypothetical protein
VLTAAVGILETTLCEPYAIELWKIPLSHNTVQKRISDICERLIYQLNILTFFVVRRWGRGSS